MRLLGLAARRRNDGNTDSSTAGALEPGVICVAEPLVFKEQQEGLFFEPALRLNTGEAQRLMDELWDCGLRPSEGTGSAGSLRATEKHLTDMQRIAFMLLERPNV